MALRSVRAPHAVRVEVWFDPFRIPLQTTLVYVDADGEEITSLTSTVDDPQLEANLVAVVDLVDPQQALF